MSDEQKDDQKNDQVGDDAHGGRGDLEPAARPELSHDARRWFRFLSLGPSVRELANSALLSLGIASQLRALRRKRKWSRREAAKRIGVHWMTLASYEWALAQMTLNTLKRMAAAYDVALIGRFESWSVGVSRAVADGYTPRDVLRWRRGVRILRPVEAPRSFDEDIVLAEMKLGSVSPASDGHSDTPRRSNAQK